MLKNFLHAIFLESYLSFNLNLKLLDGASLNVKLEMAFKCHLDLKRKTLVDFLKNFNHLRQEDQTD